MQVVVVGRAGARLLPLVTTLRGWFMLICVGSSTWLVREFAPGEWLIWIIRLILTLGSGFAVLFVVPPYFDEESETNVPE